MPRHAPLDIPCGGGPLTSTRLNRLPRRTVGSVQTAATVILLGIIALLVCVAAVSVALLQSASALGQAAASSCALFVPAMSLRTQLRRWWHRWQCWRLHRQALAIEHQISQYRLLLLDDSLRLDYLRDDLASVQREQLRFARSAE
jgi:hypothetical protein